MIAPVSCPEAQTVSIVTPADLSLLPWLTEVAGGFEIDTSDMTLDATSQQLVIESTQAGITSTPFNFQVDFVCGPITALALAATGPLSYTIGTGPTVTAWPAATPTPSCAAPNLTYSVAESHIWLTAVGTAADFTIESADTALVGTSVTLTITATDTNTSVVSS